MSHHPLTALSIATLLSLAACDGGSGDGASSIVAASSSPGAPSTSANGPGTPSPRPASSAATRDRSVQVVGTVVRFSAGSTAVEVTIDEENPAVRDFLSMLLLTLTLEEFAEREKIATSRANSRSVGRPVPTPEDGDLICFVPWGNIGFYYNTAGIGSDDTIHLGTCELPSTSSDSSRAGT
jgi:hypothetical protein